MCQSPTPHAPWSIIPRRDCGLLFLSSPVVAQQTASFETAAVAEGVYRIRWQSHNGFFVVTPAGVVAFDPISPQAAAAYATEIKRIAPGARLHTIVYSHSDADHATGARALMTAMGQQGVPIVAHEASVPHIQRAANPELPPPTVTFRDRHVLEPGGRRIELHFLGKSHSDNMLVGFVPDAGVTFAVDFVSNDRVAYQEMPGWYFPDILHAITGMLDLPFTKVVFGHGPDGDRATIQRQLVYYDDLRAAVRAAIARGLTEEQAVAQVRLPAYARWGQYEAWFPMNVRGRYRQLAGQSGAAR